jgi:hypothetical protein
MFGDLAAYVRWVEDRPNMLTELIHSAGLPKQHRLVKWVAAYCVLGYVVVVVLFLSTWCRPIEQYWAVPPNNCKLHCLLINASILVLCCL